MTTRKVSIWIRYKQGSDWPMKKAQWAGNRRHLVPGMAKGARARADEYLYYLRYRRDGKRVTESAGHDSIAVVAMATTREIELFAAERRQQASEVDRGACFSSTFATQEASPWFPDTVARIKNGEKTVCG